MAENDKKQKRLNSGKEFRQITCNEPNDTAGSCTLSRSVTLRDIRHIS